ncbi:hypothetical protein E2P81_ATG11674 [Venturia nashicola]|nr:hypothetical protein E2P81_ATG11674 [Venturia nashicola]
MRTQVQERLLIPNATSMHGNTAASGVSDVKTYCIQGGRSCAAHRLSMLVQGLCPYCKECLRACNGVLFLTKGRSGPPYGGGMIPAAAARMHHSGYPVQ